MDAPGDLVGASRFLLNDSGPEVTADNPLKRRESDASHTWAYAVTNMLQRMDRLEADWLA